MYFNVLLRTGSYSLYVQTFTFYGIFIAVILSNLHYASDLLCFVIILFIYLVIKLFTNIHDSLTMYPKD